METSRAERNTTQISVTLLFEGTKWVALVERRDDEGYAVCEVFCGLSAPMLALVYELLLATYATLEFTRPHGTDHVPVAAPRRLNFKRMQRESRRLLAHADPMVRVRDATRDERARQKNQQQRRKRHAPSRKPTTISANKHARKRNIAGDKRRWNMDVRARDSTARQWGVRQKHSSTGRWSTAGVMRANK